MNNYIVIDGKRVELSEDSVNRIKESLRKEDKLEQKFNKYEKYFRCDFGFYNGELKFYHYNDDEFDKYYNERGLIFKNKENAKKLAKIKHSKGNKIFAQIQNWVIRNDDGWKADWEDDRQLKYEVFYDVKEEKWDMVPMVDCFSNSVFMSENNAKKLVKILNSSGKYKLKGWMLK